MHAKPLKVLHVVGAMNRAGTETMLMNIYRNLNREQAQFDFISYSMGDADYDQEIQRLGGTVIKLSKTSSIKALYDVIKRNGPYDAVHSHTLFHCGIANATAFLAGVKVRIAHAHTTLDERGILRRRKLYMSLMRLLINVFSTKLLACSHGAGRYLFGEDSVRKEKYAYFPNAIDYGKFLEAPVNVENFKCKEGLENSIVVGHIGRFTEAKNHAFLLDILKRLTEKEPSVKMLLVGDGDLRKSIEKRAKDEDLYENIRFTGKRTDIHTMLHSMDVFVFPSLYEGLGLVLLEAQASGIPCVVSEAVQNEADVGLGLVSKLSLTDDANAWADRIIAASCKNERNINKVKGAFERSGYALTKGISTLMHIYNESKGEKYEGDVDRFL